jgi:hypothetical protein
LDPSSAKWRGFKGDATWGWVTNNPTDSTTAIELVGLPSNPMG